MSISVLFFGATADMVGARRIEIEAASGLTANGVLYDLNSRFSSLASHKLHISVNQEYAAGDQIVHDGDEIAIFTAVSGG